MAILNGNQGINKLSDNLNSIIDNDEINESISSKILLDEFL